MDIDYGKVCVEILDAQRESYRRERRQEEKVREVFHSFRSLLSNIEHQSSGVITALLEHTEEIYIKNDLMAKLNLSVSVNNKTVSLHMVIFVPADEAEHPKISFVHNSDGEFSSEYSEDNILKINKKTIEELKFLLSTSDRVLKSDHE
jgi:hypothetical protein